MKRFTNLRFQGRCLAGQLSEAAKKAAEKALDKGRTLEVEAAEPKSRRADGLLLGLVLVLLLAGLTKCAPVRPVPEAHATALEHAAPATGRGWHAVDTLADLPD